MPARGEHGTGLCIVDHAGHRLIGDGNIQWDGDAATAQDAEQRHSHFQAVVHEQGDPIA
jgi:hypothetical protein